VLDTAFTPLRHLGPLPSLQLRLFRLPIMPLEVEVVGGFILAVAGVVDFAVLKML